MAALEPKEDATSGRLILRVPIRARISALAFGLVWVAGAGALIYFIMNAERRIDWVAVIMVLFFAGVPALSALWSVFVTTTVTLDRTTRTLTRQQFALAMPVSSQVIPFTHLARIELQSVTKSEAPNAWTVYAVTRRNERVMLNWNGRQGEMSALAQKISTLTGAPLAETEYQLPAAVEQMLGRLAPDAVKQIRQTVESETPASPRQTSAPPMIFSPANEHVLEPAVSTEPVRAQDVRRMSEAELEQRIARDRLDFEARFVLARRYHRSGNLDHAIGLYREAARLEPANANVQNDLGIALHARGKRSDAETAYRRAVALEPFSFTAHLNLALFLRAQNRAVEASQEFFLARQNARAAAEQRLAETASAGGKIAPRLSGEV